MCGAPKKILLLILPGAAGRQVVLQRLQKLARVVVLVPVSAVQRSDWAKEFVGNDWIEWDGTEQDFDRACQAVQAWLELHSGCSINGAMTYDDFGIELCAQICKHFGLPGNSYDEVLQVRNKVHFRDLCAKVGLPTVRSTALHTDDDVERVIHAATEWPFPSVLKPAKGAGSWYVRKVDSAADLLETWQTLSRRLTGSPFPEEIKKAGFTLEEYFGGHEVDIDGWIRHGKVEFCLVSDNKPALEPHFLELGGIYPTQLHAEAVEMLKQLMASVAKAFPGLHSCFHFEAKINKKTLEAMPLELNLRAGGAECPASVESVTGYYLPEVAALLALDLPVVTSTPDTLQGFRHDVVASSNIYVHHAGILSECTDQYIDRTATKLVTSVLFSNNIGRMHEPNCGSMSCLGWLAAGGATVEEAELNLNVALTQTCIQVEPGACKE